MCVLNIGREQGMYDHYYHLTYMSTPSEIEVRALIERFVENYKQLFHILPDEYAVAEHAFISGMQISCVTLLTMTKIAPNRTEADTNVNQFVSVVNKLYKESTNPSS